MRQPLPDNLLDSSGRDWQEPGAMSVCFGDTFDEGAYPKRWYAFAYDGSISIAFSASPMAGK